jgi:hypothetical protein
VQQKERNYNIHLKLKEAVSHLLSHRIPQSAVDWGCAERRLLLESREAAALLFPSVLASRVCLTGNLSTHLLATDN